MSGIWEWLGRVVVAQGLRWGCSKAVSQSCSHLKACPGLGAPFARWHTHVTVGRRPQFPQHMDLSIGPPIYLHVMTADFPQSKWPKRKRVNWKPQCLLWPILWSHFCFDNVLALSKGGEIVCVWEIEREKEWERERERMRERENTIWHLFRSFLLGQFLAFNSINWFLLSTSYVPYTLLNTWNSLSHLILNGTLRDSVVHSHRAGL